KEHYAVWTGYGRFQLKCYKNLKELGQKISPYVKTLKKADYLSLPPKNFITVPVELNSTCREAYKSMEKDFILSLKDKNIIAPIVLAKLTKLCEITGGFITDNEGKDILLGTHKLDALLDLCNNLQESEVNRVVIYARFLWEINQIRDILGRKWTIYRISGEVKQPDRVLAERLFNNDGGAIICQIASGSLAINLQSAHHTIYYSLDYSLTNYLQSQDRTHRSGQTEPCFYYRLTCKNTIDSKILRLLDQKKNVADYVLQLAEEVKNDYSRGTRWSGKDNSDKEAT